MIQVAQPRQRVAEAVLPFDQLDEPTDEQLMHAVVRGNADALELLYDRYGSSVFGLALKMLNNDRQTAEEVVQETFWRVWDNATSFQTDGNFSGWMFGITRNLCIDIWRRRKCRPDPIQNDHELERCFKQPDPGANVAKSAWMSIKHARLRSSLDILPPEQRRVIELAYFWGLTRQEISERLDIPLGTVHTRARLALKKLRRALKEQGLGD